MFFFPRSKKPTPPPAQQQVGSAATQPALPTPPRAAASTAYVSTPPNHPARRTSAAMSTTPSTSPGGTPQHRPLMDQDDHPLADYATASLLVSPRNTARRHADPTTAPHSARPGDDVLSASRAGSMRRVPTGLAAEASKAVLNSIPSAANLQPPPAAEIHEIVMDFGDVYTGEVTTRIDGNVLIPHGHGTLQSSRARHCYVGSFKHQLRHGWGKLVTPTYALWGAWKDNRPDLSTAVRMDFPDGSKFCGYMEVLQSPVPTTPEPVSRFSQYILSVSFIKSGWGEIVYSDGRRYFGQWAHNVATGFGCLLNTDGERFIGMWRKGIFHGAGVHVAANGLVYDGLWTDGRFHCSNGDVIFSRQIRLRGDWDDAHRFRNATVVLPDRRAMERQFRITSVFEPLLLGATEAARRKAVAAIAPLKTQLDTAETVEQLDKIFTAHLQSNECFTNALKIVRRVFYFFYGTCGSSSLRGAGQRNNRLGWCYLRRSFGGCIHRALNGSVIDEPLVFDALGDLLSFVVSCHRWFMHHLGNAKEVIEDLDGSAIMSRRILDAVMDLVHAPLMNLYRHAYASEQLLLDAALHRLASITMDDIGVSFARTKTNDLFVPYASAMNALQRISRATTLSMKLNTLVRWTIDIDDETRMNQIGLHSDEAMVRVSEFFERRRQLLRDDPDAVVPIAEGIDGPERHSLASAMNIVGGSLDDLFPIHQYVLMKAGVPDLSAHARMIAHLADVDWLLDPTARESFCVTNFKACVTVVAEMHPAIRDLTGVVAPASAVVRRVEDVSETLLYGFTATFAPVAAGYLASALDWLTASADGNGVASPLAAYVIMPTPRHQGVEGEGGRVSDPPRGADGMLDPWVVSAPSPLTLAQGPFMRTLLKVAEACSVKLYALPQASVAVASLFALDTVEVDAGDAIALVMDAPVVSLSTSPSGPEEAEDAALQWVIVACGTTVLGRCPRELQLVVNALAGLAGIAGPDGVS
jgi:hypothetical protein